MTWTPGFIYIYRPGDSRTLHQIVALHSIAAHIGRMQWRRICEASRSSTLLVWGGGGGGRKAEAACKLQRVKELLSGKPWGDHATAAAVQQEYGRQS